MRRSKRARTRRPYLAALLIAGVGMVAACVGNAGPFDISLRPGSVFTLHDSNGDPTFILDTGNPACSDGFDTDVDGYTDGSPSRSPTCGAEDSPTAYGSGWPPCRPTSASLHCHKS